MFRGTPRSCFSDFSSFGASRKPVFRNFEASGLPESVFSEILRLRGAPTVHFHKKQLVGASRHLVFPNFYLSGCPEAQFSSFFARRLQAKRCFWQFLMKKHERRAVFIVFRSSLASETLFLAFSAFRSWATAVFFICQSLDWRGLIIAEITEWLCQEPCITVWSYYFLKKNLAVCSHNSTLITIFAKKKSSSLHYIISMISELFIFQNKIKLWLKKSE